jgi:putative ABC transport system substrate-binding protein
MLCAVGAGAIAPQAPWAQQPGRRYRIGWIGTTEPGGEPYNIAFVQRLAQLGFVEGRNLAIEFRSTRGRSERFAELAAEVARLDCSWSSRSSGSKC